MLDSFSRAGTTTEMAEYKRIRAKYKSKCSACLGEIPVGDYLLWDSASRSVKHDPSSVAKCEVRSGAAGGSARAEHDKRLAKADQKTRDEHPFLGELIIRFAGEPASVKKWETGAVGERKIGARLDEFAIKYGYSFLHDRRIPGTRANIDHIVVTKAGVYVVDAKRYSGIIRTEVTGILIGPRVETLYVGRRNCNKLVDGVKKQVGRVKSIVGEDVPVMGALAFVDGQWNFWGTREEVNGVGIWSLNLGHLVDVTGHLSDERVSQIHAKIAQKLPPAV